MRRLPPPQEVHLKKGTFLSRQPRPPQICVKEFLKRFVIETFLRAYNFLGRIYLAPLLFYEWKKSARKNINERAIEYGFALKWLTEIYPREVLDIGSGASAWPNIVAACGFHVTAVDKIKGYWQGGFLNRHFYIINDDITNSKISKKFDFITCISVLEHIPEHENAISGMFDLLKPGGYLLLTVPYNHKKYVENVYLLQESDYAKNAPYICQVFSETEVEKWLERNSARIIEQEFYEIFEGELWTFGSRVYPPRQVGREERCHLTCILMQKGN